MTGSRTPRPALPASARNLATRPHPNQPLTPQRHPHHVGGTATPLTPPQHTHAHNPMTKTGKTTSLPQNQGLDRPRSFMDDPQDVALHVPARQTRSVPSAAVSGGAACSASRTTCGPQLVPRRHHRTRDETLGLAEVDAVRRPASAGAADLRDLSAVAFSPVLVGQLRCTDGCTA
jgi:hypothetical protein